MNKETVMFISQDDFRDSPPCHGCPHLSYMRILNASPILHASVDVYLNTVLIASDIVYEEFTPYIPLSEGTYNISIFPYGKKTGALETETLTIKGHSIYTLVFAGQPSDFSIEEYLEPRVSIPPGKALIRFSHLSPDAPAVNLTLSSGDILFSDVQYGDLTDYREISPGTYTLQLRLPGSNQVVLTDPNALFKANRYYTIYAIGLVSGNPPLQLLLPLDGNSYIKI
jgi:hypothetical protein